MKGIGLGKATTYAAMAHGTWDMGYGTWVYGK